MSEIQNNNTQAALDAGEIIAKPQQLDPNNVYSVTLPSGGDVRVLDLDRFLPAPRRAVGTVLTQTVDDFKRYVARHDDPERTTVWVDIESYKIVAVLDDHSKDLPEWGTHRAVLHLKLTDEWQHWARLDGELVAQDVFAEHLEDGIKEIVEPDAATMLEIAQSIQGTTKASFKGGKRLQSGDITIEYVEETGASAGANGELAIPEKFQLGIAPFLGEEAYRLDATLRYRVRGPQLFLGYKLDRPGDVVRDAIDHIATGLAEAFTGDRVFIGTPRG